MPQDFANVLHNLALETHATQRLALIIYYYFTGVNHVNFYVKNFSLSVTIVDPRQIEING